jgi:hypothetical protein
MVWLLLVLTTPTLTHIDLSGEESIPLVVQTPTTHLKGNRNFIDNSILGNQLTRDFFTTAVGVRKAHQPTYNLVQLTEFSAPPITSIKSGRKVKFM